MRTPQTKASPKKGTPITPAPAKVPPVRVDTPAPWKAGAATSPACTSSPAMARGTQRPEDSSSSEESESEEDPAPAPAVGQVRPSLFTRLRASVHVASGASVTRFSSLSFQAKPVGKGVTVKAAPTPTKGPSGQGTAPAPPGKAGPAAAQAKAGKPEEDSESSSEEESDSEEEAPAAKTPLQVRPGEGESVQPEPLP